MADTGAVGAGQDAAEGPRQAQAMRRAHLKQGVRVQAPGGFDSKPPDDESEQSDYGVVTSLGYSF